ncbi:glutamate racemase [Scleromatobacter humisilvae]|uniref:Glutamate racemase n=1 Tax=Scleromatobacter humisilvae TaxID=2897159 RepID=A0A9X1YKM3_9BURK|nr:glutamate racemase [Scleromatobacter humisilvae]MCK9687165.1 glutamate racemase [Scleromatobacter humisilvae]
MRIGIFDSGVGGLSVMQAIRTRLPHAELLYAADTAYAPYGDRSEEFLCDRSERIARFLREQGAQMIVVACNTATAAAVARLRATWTTLPVVGVEPGVKPAVAVSAAHRVGVLATTRTLASEKFRRLAEAHADGATLVLQPCPGLADAIEAADAQGSGLDVLVDRYCAPLRDAGVDVAVLGCTHYVFARELFERALPGVRLIDTADAVARQTARFADELVERGEADASTSNEPALRAWSSGSPQVLANFARRWLDLRVDVQDMHC